MNLRCSLPSLASSGNVEAWTGKAILSVTERLSQVRKRSRDDETPYHNVEVVLVNPSAACGHRGEPRKRSCPLFQSVVILLTVACVVGFFLLIEHESLLESSAARAQRMQEMKHRAAEAEFSKQLWADVLKLRLQEQTGLGQPAYGDNLPAAAWKKGRGQEEGVTVAGRNGVLAAGLPVSDDDGAPTSTAAKPFSAPLSPVVASLIEPASSTQRAITGTTFHIEIPSLRVPPEGFSQELRGAV